MNSRAELMPPAADNCSLAACAGAVDECFNEEDQLRHISPNATCSHDLILIRAACGDRPPLGHDVHSLRHCTDLNGAHVPFRHSWAVRAPVTRFETRGVAASLTGVLPAIFPPVISRPATPVAMTQYQSTSSRSNVSYHLRPSSDDAASALTGACIL